VPDRYPSGRPAPFVVESALGRYVDITTLHMLQDRFADLGQVSVIICNVDGSRITGPTWGSRYSALIGNSTRGSEEFNEALKKLAASTDKSATVECLEGMTLFHSFIEHDGARLAMIVTGTRPAVLPPDDRVRRIAAHYGIDADLLVSVIERDKQHTGSTPESTRQFAETLAQTIASLYHQAARIRSQLNELQTVHGLANLLAGQRDLREILDLTVQRVVEIMGVKACGIRLLNEETGELVVKAVCNLSKEYLAKGPVTLDQNPIDSAAFAGETVYIEDAPNDPRIRYPEMTRREGIVSGLCVPMTYRGRTIGVMRVYTSRRYRFSRTEESLLRSIGAQTASAVINSRLAEERVQAERIRRQVEAAAEIQRRMLPAAPPKSPAIDFGAQYVPSLQASGDLYDFIVLEDGRIGVCVADVVGKGLPAALMMASIRAALRTSAHCEDSVSGVVAEVNRHLTADTRINEFATLFYGIFSADGSMLTYCNAGHPPGALLRGEAIIELDEGGMVIGIDARADYEQKDVALQPGDLIVLVSDGVTEAMDFQEHAYGFERLHASVRKRSGLDADQLAAQLLWDVRRFVGLSVQSDDITVVAARITG